jgi:hypothetical protein
MLPRRASTPIPALAALILTGAALAGPEWNGPAFYGVPPTETNPWAVHDRNRPQPKRVEPGTPSTQTQPGKPPSDAIVLFDGTAASLAKWESLPKDGNPAGPAQWIVKDGALEVVPKTGPIRTKEHFGDCQLHVEWAAPSEVKGDSQGRGNSGIFLMGLTEVQVLDNYNNPTYADGSANSLYAINPPLVNALRAPGEFQTVDIIFRRPIYRDGKLVDAGRVTVICNGVVMQDSTPILAENYHLIGWKSGTYPDKGPLQFQDHGDKVRFRNVWYRPLPPRAVEGGTEGALSPAAALAKRKDTAAKIRADAATMKADAHAYLLRLAESLVYERDEPTAKQVEQLAAGYISGLKALSGPALDAKKSEVLNAARVFAYLTKWDIYPKSFAPKSELERFIKAKGWDEQPQKKKKA